MNKALFLGCLIAIISGCKLIRTASAVFNKEVKTQEYLYKDKSIIFIPISHVSKIKFYKNLTDSIKKWKSNEYTIFYEEIHHNHLDSVKLKQTALKWRKIRGKANSFTRDSYNKKSKILKFITTQPTYDLLGIDSTDVNADIGLDEVIHQYEKLYGEVKLDSCDYLTPYDSSYHCSEKLENDLSPILLDYRNKRLVDMLINTNLTKIAVIYGKTHMYGMKKILEDKTNANPK